MNTFKGLPIISMPKDFQRIVDKRNNKLIKKKASKKDLGELIIRSKNKNRNFYMNQQNQEGSKKGMASRGWNKNFSKGDFFQINAYSKPSAFDTYETHAISFGGMGIDERIVKNLKQLGFKGPTNAQCLGIPNILQGCNSLISSETGSGKTHTYLIPLVQQLLRANKLEPERELRRPKALIILPSRELAVQTKEMAKELTRGMNFEIMCELGGGMLTSRVHTAEISSPDILIGSFGTISKLFTLGNYKRQLVNHIVLDEIDTLLDDSFSKKVTYFLSKFSIRVCPHGRAHEPDIDSGVQLTFIGATFSNNSLETLYDMVDKRSVVHVQTGMLHNLAAHVSHTFLRVGRENRDELLLRKVKGIIAQKKNVVVFTNKSDSVFYIRHLLHDTGVEHGVLSADVERKERIMTYKRFCNGDIRCIVCTDLMSRGLNTVNTNVVINYKMPKFMSDYIHRCGRVGRVGSPKDSKVVNFVRPYDTDIVNQIEQAVRTDSKLPNVDANIRKHYSNLFPEEINKST